MSASVKARKSIGQPLDGVAKLRVQFDTDLKRFSDDPVAEGTLVIAFGYVTGYPMFLEWVGHEWRAEGERTAAYYSLNSAHTQAMHVLMKAAERVNIDGAPLWEYGRICRELFADEPWKYCVASHDTWPECLGLKRRTLPADYRQAIRVGEAALMRLNARFAIGRDASLDAVTSVAPSAWQPPRGYVRTATVRHDKRFQKGGKNPPATTILDTWRVKSGRRGRPVKVVTAQEFASITPTGFQRPGGDDSSKVPVHVIRDPQTRELLHPETWVRWMIDLWTPQNTI